MQPVTQYFVDAIKNENRELHGYILAQYQNETYNTEVTEVPQSLSITKQDGSGIVNGEKIMNKYATLEENYTLLDGSFMLWNENTILNNGFISNNTFENINDTTITVENNSVDKLVKGITIYFRENLPFDFTLSIFDENNNQTTENITNNMYMTYKYIFPYEKKVSKITLEISRVEFSKQRIKLSCIDFNIGDLYEGNELISFNVSERIDLLSKDLPANTCTVNLNNYPNTIGGNKFDPINPKGITKYLTNDSTLQPFIGVLTEDYGIEYVKMGTFYISDWSSNTDGNVTINGKDLIDKLKNTIIPSNGTFCYHNNSYWEGLELGNYLSSISNQQIRLYIPNNRIFNDVLKHMELVEYLRMINICSQSYNINRIFKTARDNAILINEVNYSIVDRISRKELKDDVDYKINSSIKKLEFTTMKNDHNLSTGSQDVLNLSYSLSKEDEYLWIPIESVLINYHPTLFPKTFSYTTTGTGTAEFVDCNDRLVYIHLSGQVGDTFTIHLTTAIFDIDGNITTNIDNDSVGETLSIDVSEYFRILDSDIRDSICAGLMNTQKKYTIVAETFGNPALETGDIIAIQTRYGENQDSYKNIMITELNFSYDGGLDCEIKGIGD